jgi:putative DNA methylase
MTMSHPVKSPKKLIEVALPLDAINVAAAREKSIRHGHPSTLHLWWARRPLAAARAVIFGQMVNDPSWKWELEHPGEIPPNNLKATWAASRKRLFSILEELVKWDNTTNEAVLEKARAEIRKSWKETCELNKDHPRAGSLFNPDKLPAFHDPFAGGGALPLEAQRLGLEAYASDLNPVAVLMNKAMIEIPPKFAGRHPVNPEARNNRDLIEHDWSGSRGLAEDVRYYGQWMRDEAYKRIGHLYPLVEVTADMAKSRPDLKPLIGEKLTVIAWIWARTVRSPNPAFAQVHVPLASTFLLATKEHRQAYVEPLVEGSGYHFAVRVGTASDAEKAKNGTKLPRANFRCLMSGAPIDSEYIMTEARAGRIGTRLMATVVEGNSGRVYLSPTEEMSAIAESATPTWRPDVEFFQQALGFRVGNYGMTKWSDLFTSRQIVALSTLCDLVQEARERVRQDARAAGVLDEEDRTTQDSERAIGYIDAVAVYLGLIVSRLVNLNNALCQWRNDPAKEHVGHLFARQAIPMVWDFAEANPFGQSGGSYDKTFGFVPKVLLFLPIGAAGHVQQADAAVQSISIDKVVSTDPPYYDNVGYADLSDFFYVWLRRALKPIVPDLFTTRTAPKTEELVATPARHGGKERAESFFLNGMTQAMHRLTEQAHPAFPVTIYYAFKQAESDRADGTSSTGWETFLDAVIRAGFATTGTWPMRTELANRMRGADSNALASSIVLVCRSRPTVAATTSRRAFLRELNQVLPQALDEMTKGAGHDRSPVAPVDLSQAIIGPGMALFSKYSAVLEADGTPMTVRTALQLINRFLAEDDFDHDTQFCLHWFEQHGWKDGKFGDADTLARAKGTSVDGVKHAGVLFAAGGIVRLLKWSEYPSDWEPSGDPRLPVWEVVHQLIRVFRTDGESGAGRVLSAIESKAESTRQLAYRLYTLCERAGWAEDARAYNEIITSWSSIESAAAAIPAPKQTTLF